MSEHNFTLSISIYDLSHERVLAAIPTIVCLCISILIGLIGNICVVIVFGFKMKKQSTYRHFILVLSMYDLMACVFGMPGLTAELSRPYLFYKGSTCRALRYGFHMMAGGSSLTHLLVGVDRYRRICRGTSVQMSLRSAKLCSLVVIVVIFIGALPVAIMYDTVQVKTRVANITGHSCDISEQYTATILPILYNGLLMAFSLITIAVLIVLYSLIGRKICTHVEFFQQMEHGANRTNTRTSKLVDFGKDNNKIEPVAPTSCEQSVQDSTPYGHNADQYTTTVIPIVTQTTHASRAKSTNVRQKQSRERLSRKMTVVTFAIMVVFILSFIPLEVLELVTLLHKDIENSMSFSQLVFYKLGYHSYIINNVANPLIYVFMDVEFRRHCKSIFAKFNCKA